MGARSHRPAAFFAGFGLESIEPLGHFGRERLVLSLEATHVDGLFSFHATCACSGSLGSFLRVAFLHRHHSPRVADVHKWAGLRLHFHIVGTVVVVQKSGLTTIHKKHTFWWFKSKYDLCLEQKRNVCSPHFVRWYGEVNATRKIDCLKHKIDRFRFIFSINITNYFYFCQLIKKFHSIFAKIGTKIHTIKI